MQVIDYFKRLSLGHLSNLSLSNEGDGSIRIAEQNKIISYMNEGLQKIYSRFCLREKSVLIRQYRHITNYHLDKQFATFNSERLAEHKPYILDLPAEPFSDDAIKILAVFNECRENIPLNDPNIRGSMMTPYPTILQVSDPEEGRPLSVQYQATHIKLEYGVTNNVINLPVILETPFLSYIASCVYRDMNTQEATAKGQEHFLSYETACADIEEKDHASISTVSRGTKFHERGWC